MKNPIVPSRTEAKNANRGAPEGQVHASQGALVVICVNHVVLVVDQEALAEMSGLEVLINPTDHPFTRQDLQEKNGTPTTDTMSETISTTILKLTTSEGV